MKVLAIYLPQFHRVQENDEWWGEGFTEWVTAKNASPLFEGHYQPHEPLNDYYYDLMEKNTMIWQTDLMHQYGIDGMCFYHYWFKDGRKILEKPAENLLEWKEVDMPFCFCWANQSWARTWSNIEGGNPWADNYEKDSDKKRSGKAILLEQKYGNEEDWKNHFYYLLPFFQDERYIKIDNRPVFMFYDSERVLCIHEMMECWNRLAQENGISSLYFITFVDNSTGEELGDCVQVMQPGNFFWNKRLEDGINYYDYDEMWKSILQNSNNDISTAVVSYDDTPRRGLQNGYVVVGDLPEKFEKYLSYLLIQAEERRTEIVCINAWNEWGEGMCLEPDKRYEFGYLLAVKKARSEYRNRIEDYRKYMLTCNKSDTTYLYKQLRINLLIESIENRWITILENGQSISKWIFDKGYRKIAIYGWGKLGKHLWRECNKSDIEVSCVIDKSIKYIEVDVPFYRPGEEILDIDLIVVTVPFYFKSIAAMYKFYNIVSISSIVEEMFEGIAVEY